ncbi:MAG TPA: hypothetical protein VHF23_04985 [Gaiellaceae bacterium]|nr:hypothetical protein [Gaiellaceae bacterium]
MGPSWWIAFGASPPGQRRKEVREIVEANGGTLEGFWQAEDRSRYYGVVSDLDLDEELKNRLRVDKADKVADDPLRRVRREDEPR